MLSSKAWRICSHVERLVPAVTWLLHRDVMIHRRHTKSGHFVSGQHCQQFIHSASVLVRTCSTLSVPHTRDSTEQGNDNYDCGISATDKISNLSVEDERKLKCVKFEYEILEYEGANLPRMNDERWLTLVYKSSSIERRLSYYSKWLRTDEKAKSRLERRKKKVTAPSVEDEKKTVTTPSVEDEKKTLTIGHNQIMFPPNQQKMDYTHFNNLTFAMQFSDKLVIDLSLGTCMTRNERRAMEMQFSLLYKYNKEHRDPFHLILTGCEPDQYLPQRIHTLDANASKGVGVTITQDHYIDLFPRDKLVYLTPDARDVLHDYDSDDLYIIGGLVDIQQHEPLTYAQAKKEGIRSARLPMDSLLKWKGKDKSFNIDQMMALMLEIKDSRDWKRAFLSMPNVERKVYIL